MRTFIIGSCLLALVLVAAPAKATDVGLELLLLTDVSGSVDSGEYNLQKTGYVNAFNDAAIQTLISGTTNGIAVAYAEWSWGNEQAMLVDWTHLTDATSASDFADALAATSRAFNGNTAPGSAINWGVDEFDDNGFDGNRLVIDISGDGAENTGADTFTAATDALDAGITVNGLPIGQSLETWYQNNIVTPGGGFLVVAQGFDSFETAIYRKLYTEIEGVPEPGTIALLGLGLAGLVVVRRRRK